jgi:hypothetical protein
MALFWLAYRRGSELAGVAIIEAASIIHARMCAALGDLDAGLDFAEGHQFDAKLSAALKPAEIGRMLAPSAARKVLGRFERS